MIETSVLVSGSIFWEYKKPNESIILEHEFFDQCSKLFDFLRENSQLEIGIVTKTIEDEAKNVFNKAVNSTIRQTHFPDLEMKIKTMVLQDIIANDCFDRLEKNIEECSIRPPIIIKERERILSQEIQPFMKELVEKTVRYIQPRIPGFIKGRNFRAELTKIMVKSLPSKGIIYKGMPAGRDLSIMSEATMIFRKYAGKEKVYVASMDRHFIPNPIQVGSFLSGHKEYLDEKDSTVRDMLAEEFGFVGEEPDKLMEIIEREFKL